MDYHAWTIDTEPSYKLAWLRREVAHHYDLLKLEFPLTKKKKIK